MPPSPHTPPDATKRLGFPKSDDDPTTDDLRQALGESDRDEPTDSTAPAYARLPDLDEMVGEGGARESTSEALFGAIPSMEPKQLDDPPTLSDREVQMNLRQVVEDSRFTERTSKPVQMRTVRPPTGPSPLIVGGGILLAVLLLAALVALLT